MATSLNKNQKGNPATTTGTPPNNLLSSDSKEKEQVKSIDNNGAAKKAVPLFSFSPDVTPEFQENIENFISGVEGSLKAQVSSAALGSDANVAFKSVREGDLLYITVPLTLNRGDTLAELILLMASKLPNAVLRQGNEGWEEPEWTSETRKALHGIVVALQGSPASLASSTSPVDLARLAVWVSACNTALSVKGGAEGTVGSVLPTSVGGAKSASKYLAKVMGSLRATSSEKKHQEAVKSLEQLLKLWYKEVREEALALVRKNKISWGTVLLAGAPTTQKKVKGSMITQIKSPSKPSKSPFLSGKEGQALSKVYNDSWNTIDTYRINWNALSSEEQHREYKNYIALIKKHYENLNKLSTTVHAKLGHRKRWIHSACKEMSVGPSKKKDKSNEYMWTLEFFKLDLTALNPAVKLVFAPSHYLTDLDYGCTDTLTALFRTRREKGTDIEITAVLCRDENVRALWQEWTTRFNPDFRVDLSRIQDVQNIKDDNPYAALAVPSENEEIKNADIPKA